ncbi:SRPBCC family protein [Adhaeribacter aerolatus]|nr:SRPBCC family protein [Adhaeribacter aerolatus]
MKMLLNILIGVAGFIALLLILALFVKKEYTVARQIIINKPQGEVFAYIRHLKNQEHYSKWVMADPDMKKTYRGTDGTPGFVYAWNGNDKAGQGEQEIKHITENEKLEIEIRFIRPFAGVAQVPMTTETVSPTQTKVTWGMTGGNPYPLNLMHLFTDNLLGKDLEISLATLKQVVEKN